MTVVVELRGLVRRYGAKLAVDRLSFAVDQGQCLSLLGPSGCGKTTTLRMIAGFEQPDEGDVFIEGQAMRGRRPYERNVGLVFQDYMLFPHMTVAENVAYGMRRRGVDGRERARRLAECLHLVRLAGYEQRMPRQLSGGEQQRVAIARALVTRPAVMLLDEPLSNLDTKLRTEVRIEIKEILAASGITTIIVTHDQEEAMTMADRIVVMQAGRLMQEGTPDEIYGKPANRFTADFIGRMNWFEAERQADGTLRLRGGPGLARAPGCSAAHFAIGVRPERLTIAPGPADICLPATVRTIENLGPDLNVQVVLEDGATVLLTLKNTGAPRPAIGERVRIGFAQDACIVLPAPS